MIRLKKFRSPVGVLTGASDGESILGLWIDGQKYFGSTLPPETEMSDADPALELLEGWLNGYFAGKKPSAEELPLSPSGSPYRRTVWKCLMEIPYGATASYGAVAERASALLGRRTSPRAVGGAVGHNPISIVIPCHRVVGADGGLTGYAGGTDIKLWLLRHEAGANG